MTVRPARALGRSLALGLVAAASLLGGVVLAAPAHAAVLGPITIDPTSGNDFTSWGGAVTTNCPDGTGDSFFSIQGPDLAGAPDYPGFLGPGNASGDGEQSFAGAAISNLRSTSPAGAFATTGTYSIRFNCVATSDGQVSDYYEALMSYTAGGDGAWTIQSAAVDRATATTLAAAPTTAAAGAPVVLTADVTPTSGNDDPVGSVAFRNGSTTLGTAAVGAGGVATLTTDDLPVGTNSLTAVFTAGAGFDDSTSAAVTVTITAAPTTSPSPTTSVPTTTAPSSTTTTTTGPSSTATGIASTGGGGVLGSGSGTGGGGLLAATGIELAAGVLSGTVLVGLGVLLVVWARRQGWLRRGTHRA